MKGRLFGVLGVLAIVVSVVSICALIVVLVLKGGISANVTTIASLVTFMGVLITALITAISTLNIGTKLNGHLAKHEQAVVAAETAAVTAGSVSEQLARAQDILDKIHVDTNSSYAEMRREVADGRREVADGLRKVAELMAEMERLRTEMNARQSPGGGTP